jgi:uncharacterized protein
LTRQPWSNGKLGTFGCSGSAEEQHKLNASHPSGLAAIVPISSRAGIGRVGPYNEHGNFYHDPANAKKHGKEGFDALWRMLT